MKQFGDNGMRQRLFTLLLLNLLSVPAFSSEIIYEVYDKATEQVVAKGIKVYSKEDVIKRSYRTEVQSVVEKYVELENGYQVGARIFLEEKLTGFGLVSRLTDRDFSWDWYNLESGSIFQKLKDKTLVKVRVSGAPLLEILEEVDFLEDAVLRFRLNGTGHAESHEIRIKKGSVLKFD